MDVIIRTSSENSMLFTKREGVEFGTTEHKPSRGGTGGFALQSTTSYFGMGQKKLSLEHRQYSSTVRDLDYRAGGRGFELHTRRALRASK